MDGDAALATAAKPIIMAVAQNVLSMKTSDSSFSFSSRYRRAAARSTARTEATTVKH
jgi:hypothetical protein